MGGQRQVLLSPPQRLPERGCLLRQRNNVQPGTRQLAARQCQGSLHRSDSSGSDRATCCLFCDLPTLLIQAKDSRAARAGAASEGLAEYSGRYARLRLCAACWNRLRRGPSVRGYSFFHMVCFITALTILHTSSNAREV